MGVNSAEYKTLKKHTNELCLTVKADLIGLGGALFADDLITKEQNDDLSNQTHARRDRAAKLIGLILDKVELDPQNYHTFIGVLERRDLAQYGRIVRQLQETILDSGGGTVTTPRVQLPKQVVMQQASSPMATTSPYRSKLDLVIDSENGGVPRHQGQIADSMDEWEGSIADGLGLTPAEVAAIKTKYPNQLNLQTRVALSKWKQKTSAATYNNLIGIFETAGRLDIAVIIRQIFNSAFIGSSKSEGACVGGNISAVSPISRPQPTPPPEPATRHESFPGTVRVNHLKLIKWTEGGETKRFYLMEKIETKWRDIGQLISISPTQLDSLAAEHRDKSAECCRAVLGKWLDNPPDEYPITWDGLIELLVDCELTQAVKELKAVLRKANLS